jgi:glycosyltransferase involved in cell wall biosynthesis
MRIVHIVGSMEVGGAEVMVASLCRIHRRQGHQVAVHCIFRNGPLGEQLAREGIPVIVHGQGSRLATMRSLYRSFAVEPWDVGHCHNVVATVWGAPALRAAGVRRVFSTRHSLVRPPYDVRQEIQYSLASRLCSRVVGVCRATSENLSHAPLADSGRIATIYNGAAAPALLPGGAPPRPQGFTFATVSRLASPKDPETLIRAFAEARAAFPDAVLWIVGDGELRNGLEQLARQLGLHQSVIFWGERQNPGDFLHAADAFVLSSRSEGVPISLLEAMSVGLPCIASDVGGLGEVTRSTAAGAVVPPGEVAALAAALRAYAADPAAARAAGTRAREQYFSHFTVEAMAASYDRLYAE